MPPATQTKTVSKLFERFMLVFATVEPLATIPQILQVWSGTSAGVSLGTWFFYSITSCVWFMYGIKANDKPLMISGVLWVLSQGLVVAGILFR